MENLIRFSLHDLSKVTNHRSGEVKFGEKMITIPKDIEVVDFIKTSEAKFVLFGIPEDVGILANAGRAGANSAWESAIKSIANIQHNKFCKGYDLIVLGTLDTKAEMEEVQNLDFNNTAERKRMSELVSKIDKEVVHIIRTIINCGKIPIIIGGGHNNSYGNIKGTALANGKPINAVNFDAHSDFRILEGRHSGNGFSYAHSEGFLKNISFLAYTKAILQKSVLKELRENENVIYNTYDEIKIRGEKNFQTELVTALSFINADNFGIEIDLDAVPNIPSSAITPSGFSVEELRQFIYFFGKQKNASYIHICEGAPSLDHEKNNHLTGKLIGYLVTDFIKAKNSLFEV